MRFRHIMQLLLEPQLITPQAHAGIMSLVVSRIEGAMPQREGQDMCGEKVELPSMTVEDGIAIVPVSGVMGSKLTGMEKGSGAVDVSDIIRDVQFSNTETQVKAIRLDVDSPGGMYQGTPELGDVLAASNKPIFAFTNGQMCSAAYWAGASTKAIFATRSASIGSIGVYCAMLDMSGAFEKAGYRMELFASDIYKGAGTPGVPLTTDQRVLIQERVNRMAAEFKGHVVSMRGSVSADVMRGQTFSAIEAERENLIDGVVSNRAEAIALAKEMIS
jgi:ClpP class serine protease